MSPRQFLFNCLGLQVLLSSTKPNSGQPGSYRHDSGPLTSNASHRGQPFTRLHQVLSILYRLEVFILAAIFPNHILTSLLMLFSTNSLLIRKRGYFHPNSTHTSSGISRHAVD